MMRVIKGATEPMTSVRTKNNATDETLNSKITGERWNQH